VTQPFMGASVGLAVCVLVHETAAMSTHLRKSLLRSSFGVVTRSSQNITQCSLRQFILFPHISAVLLARIISRYILYLDVVE